MKKHRLAHPIGKCKGCCLNFKTFCRAGLIPKDEWDRGRCRHYDDKGLLEQALNQPPPTGAHAARLERQARAARMGTEPHHNGVLDPGKMAGRAKRHAR
ncbi:MAG TPA: hypothetical protein VM098_06300 [Phycisphaerae bacterium]|nr:hypothetical protein [Phycisphaerae bacterium]